MIRPTLLGAGLDKVRFGLFGIILFWRNCRLRGIQKGRNGFI